MLSSNISLKRRNDKFFQIILDWCKRSFTNANNNLSKLKKNCGNNIISFVFLEKCDDEYLNQSLFMLHLGVCYSRNSAYLEVSALITSLYY